MRAFSRHLCSGGGGRAGIVGSRADEGVDWRSDSRRSLRGRGPCHRHGDDPYGPPPRRQPHRLRQRRLSPAHGLSHRGGARPQLPLPAGPRHRPGGGGRHPRRGRGGTRVHRRPVELPQGRDALLERPLREPGLRCVGRGAPPFRRAARRRRPRRGAAPRRRPAGRAGARGRAAHRRVARRARSADDAGARGRPPREEQHPDDRRADRHAGDDGGGRAGEGVDDGAAAARRGDRHRAPPAVPGRGRPAVRPRRLHPRHRARSRESVGPRRHRRAPRRRWPRRTR